MGTNINARFSHHYPAPDFIPLGGLPTDHQRRLIPGPLLPSASHYSIPVGYGGANHINDAANKRPRMEPSMTTLLMGGQSTQHQQHYQQVQREQLVIHQEKQVYLAEQSQPRYYTGMGRLPPPPPPPPPSAESMISSNSHRAVAINTPASRLLEQQKILKAFENVRRREREELDRQKAMDRQAETQRHRKDTCHVMPLSKRAEKRERARLREIERRETAQEIGGKEMREKQKRDQQMRGRDHEIEIVEERLRERNERREEERPRDNSRQSALPIESGRSGVASTASRPSDRNHPERGWVIRNKDKMPVNVKNKDETLINLALSGMTTLESQLRICSKPIIGLNYVIEFIDPSDDANIRVYHCQLCSIFRTAATILEHLTSYKHRVRTLSKRFPSECNVFLEPDRRSIARSSGLMTLATRKASDLELVYGRGEMQVRRERPNFPDSPDADLEKEDTDLVITEDTRKLDLLHDSIKNLNNIRFESREEHRLAKILLDKLSSALADYELLNPQSTDLIDFSSTANLL